MTLSLDIHETAGAWTASVPELPDVEASGASRDEALTMLLAVATNAIVRRSQREPERLGFALTAIAELIEEIEDAIDLAVIEAARDSGESSRPWRELRDEL